MNNKKILLIVLFFITSPHLAYADIFTKPTELTAIKATSPYGQGTLSHIWIKVYDAALWTDAANWSMESPFALSVIYAIGIDVDDLINKTIEEMKHVHDIPDADLTAYAAKLSAIYPPVHSGDRITASFSPPNDTSFYYNGRLVGKISDPVFATRFFDIWLSPKTSRPALREGLLNIHRE